MCRLSDGGLWLKLTLHVDESEPEGRRNVGGG